MFLKGIDKPIAPIATDADKNSSALQHKFTLLGKVRELFVIHSSSNKAMEAVYMLARGERREVEVL